MPLDVQRLRDSDLASDETPEACWAAVLLWCASWHQVPAASIPNNEQWLAKQAGYLSRGRIDPMWPKVRDGAMRGWVLCDDGRFYHPVVAEKALDAWKSKLEQRWRTECNRVKKHNQRHEMSLPVLSFDAWMSAGCPQGQLLPVPEDKNTQSQGTTDACPREVSEETPSKRQGEGQGQGQGDLISPSLRSGDDGKTSSDPPPAKPKRAEISLKTYLANCKAEGRKPIPEDHYVRRYCRDTGITEEMVQIAWLKFRRDYTEGTKKAKRYKDWPAHFANCVENRWHQLWFVNDRNEVEWTSNGLQAKRFEDAERDRRAQEAAHAPA